MRVSWFPVLENEVELGFDWSESAIDVEDQRAAKGNAHGNICPDNPKNHLNTQFLQLLFGRQMFHQFFKGGQLAADSFFGFGCHLQFEMD